MWIFPAMKGERKVCDGEGWGGTEAGLEWTRGEGELNRSWKGPENISRASFCAEAFPESLCILLLLPCSLRQLPASPAKNVSCAVGQRGSWPWLTWSISIGQALTGLMKEGSGLLQGPRLLSALTWLPLRPTAKGCLMTHPPRAPWLTHCPLL